MKNCNNIRGQCKKEVGTSRQQIYPALVRQMLEMHIHFLDKLNTSTQFASPHDQPKHFIFPHIIAHIHIINSDQDLHQPCPLVHYLRRKLNIIPAALVPLVEKFAEHLTAIDEAWDNEMNMALSHVLGATIQTSLFNGPLVVLTGWVTHKEMDLNFDLFNIIVLILAILVVGNFLRDQKSNYLEGALCVIVYINIAVAAFYYPNPKEPESRPELSVTNYHFQNAVA